MLVCPECRDDGVLVFALVELAAWAVGSATVPLVGWVVAWLAVPARATPVALVADLSKEILI